MEPYYPILIGLAGIVLGFIINRFLLKRSNSKKIHAAEEQKKLILKETELSAESIKKDKILEAKETYLKIKTEFEEEANRKKKPDYN